MTQTVSVKEKIERVEAASKAGLLKDYTPAAQSNDPKSSASATPMSWGSAMRR